MNFELECKVNNRGDIFKVTKKPSFIFNVMIAMNKTHVKKKMRLEIHFAMHQ